MARAAAKKISKKEAKPIKYSDKSTGQPQLTPIFNELVKLMEPFAKDHLKKLAEQKDRLD